MIATTSAAPTNRVRQYFDPTATLPATPQERQDAYAECVSAALAVLRARLRSTDDKVAGDAAKLVVALEQTRMRHGAAVAGCAVPGPTFEETQRMLAERDGLLAMTDDRDDEDAEEDEAEEAEPAYAATTQEAVAAHAAEMLGVLRWGKDLYPATVEGEPDLPMATRLVEGHLQRMGKRAVRIPVGEFWDAVGRWQARA